MQIYWFIVLKYPCIDLCLTLIDFWSFSRSSDRLWSFPLEKQSCKGRQGEVEGKGVTMGRDGPGFDPPLIPQTATPVHVCITIEDFSPKSALWGPHPVVMTGNRREIKDADDIKRKYGWFPEEKPPIWAFKRREFVYEMEYNQVVSLMSILI